MTDFLSDTSKRLLINGIWVSALSGKTINCDNPSNGSRIGSLAFAGKDDVNLAAAAAHSALTGPWSKLSPSDRETLLHRLGDLISANSEELARLESIDNGKPIWHTRAIDVGVAARQAHFFAGWPSKIAGYTPSVNVPDKFVYTRREPVGVAAIIIPWNYPLIHTMQKMSPALACGNTVILKPAEQASLAALRLGELTQEAGFPPGVVNTITGDGPTTGSALASHPIINKVAFTGSVSAGQSVMQAAAGTVKRVSLELGNKSANIIFPDADLTVAIPGAFKAAFGNSGQSCVAGARLFIHRKVYDKVVEQLIALAETVQVGPAMDPETKLGPIISRKQMERILGYIRSGIEQGAALQYGGRRIDTGDLGKGYFIEPTIFTGVTDEMAIACEEIFGPVLSIFSFDTEEEVVERANQTRFGLASGVWTSDLARAHRVAAALKSGVVWVNTYDMFDPAAPFGGYKNSGFGRDNGREVIDAYTEVKAVWIDTRG